MKSAIQLQLTDEPMTDYEQLLSLSQRMLSWSRLGEWQALFEEESRYIAKMERIFSHQSGSPSDYDELEKRSDIIEQILDQSLEIRQRLVSRRDEIGALLKSSQHRNNLRQVYGTESAMLVQ